MLRAGDVYRVEIPGEKTDHYWIMVTDVDKQGRIAYAMLTDARNLDFPQVVFPRGTSAWAGFKLGKETVVDAARSNIREAIFVEKVLTNAGQYQGLATPSFLDAVRKALQTAPETPSAVKNALEHKKLT